MRVLVVDDEAALLEGIRRVLEADGVEVVLAGDAETALAMVAGGNFGLALVDLKMPGRDGIWLIKEINERRPELPIVAISGYPTIDTVADVFARRVSGFVAKPFTPEELREAVRGFYQRTTT